MKKTLRYLRPIGAGAVLLALSLVPPAARASSHMDAPLITLDPSSNTTDVYAFRADIGAIPYLVVSLAVYPFEEPGIGPNIYMFDPNVSYEIHLATGSDLSAGKSTYTYRFQFQTAYANTGTVAQAFLNEVQTVGDAGQNLLQSYNVQMVAPDNTNERRRRRGNTIETSLFSNVLVPPNNQGRVTRFYNTGDNGDAFAKGGVNQNGNLDTYTKQTIANNGAGYLVFAGQRDDGFYADIQSIFDLDFSFSGPNKPFDSQGGFNVHTIVLAIPLSEIGGAQQIAGVYATTSRAKVTVLKKKTDTSFTFGDYVQVGRQGNPLFNEAFVAIQDKDLYNSVSPEQDSALFSKYALNPELATLLGAPENRRTNRTDLAGIFIPDLIKVDLSTPPARLAGNGASAPTTKGVADQPGFHRLSIFGGDVLKSQVQNPFNNDSFIPGGWPNGRRFGDDVLDIGVLAVLSDLRPGPGFAIVGNASSDVDKVKSNDIGYNQVFPYAATPLNGRNHQQHHGSPAP